VAAVAGDRVVGGGLLMHAPAEDRWLAHLSGGVLPEFRRRGIGREIMDRLIRQAGALRSAAGSGLPGQLKIWVPHGRPSATAFAAAAGFQARRYFFEMRAQLDVTPDVPELPGLCVRPWTPADDDGTRLAYNDAFADHWGSVPMGLQRWRRSFAESPFFRPDVSRLAVRGNEVVGFVLVDEFDSETEARGFRTGYIDRVGSIRSVRGQGVASALLAHSMVALADSGCAIAELNVDADSPTGAGRLYERLGFATRNRSDVYVLDF
jgi:mycothiol synthase